jgi:hypothetical protein
VGSLLSATKGTTSGGKAPIDPMLLPFDPGGPRNAGDPGWQWQSAPAATGPWTNISLANGPTHTITASEKGLFLRIEATHADSASPTPATAVGHSAAVGPVTVAPLTWKESAVTHRRYEMGRWDDWTQIIPAPSPKPAGAVGNVCWLNAVTGDRVWQSTNPGADIPPNFVKGSPGDTAQGFTYGPTVKSGQFVYRDLVYRAPGGPAAWHFDTTHEVWTDGTRHYANNGNNDPRCNPGYTPAPNEMTRAVFLVPPQSAGTYGLALIPGAYEYKPIGGNTWQLYRGGVPEVPRTVLTQVGSPHLIPP